MNNRFWFEVVHGVVGLSAALILTAAAHGMMPPALSTVSAKAMFAEAKAVSDKEGGATWGKALYGPMMFVDPGSKTIIANQPDAQGLLKPQDGLFIGKLPADVLPANTAFDWQGKRWTMLEWPVWGDRSARARLLAHEMFHRIQPELHLSFNDKPNPQLDSLEGRLWLQLEWRALAAALTSNGKARDAAIRDALAFRSHRAALFAGSADSERLMDLNEGLAEYTGVEASATDVASARWIAAQKLLTANEKTWVRSFPYVSGPAYGLLLDELSPGWRARLSTTSDLSVLLSGALPKAAVADAKVRARIYGEAELRRSETERAAEADAVKARYRAALVDGPVLTLPNLGTHFRVSFDPRDLVPLGEAGTVYPTMQVSDEWGTLIAKQGTLMSSDWQHVFVIAPSEVKDSHVAGDGWTLDLAPGWKLVPSGKPGSFTVQKG